MDLSQRQTTAKSSEWPPVHERKKHILLLGEAWDCSGDGGLSHISTEMAKQFAMNEEVQISYLVAETEKDQQDQARKYGVDLVQAVRMEGYAPLDCLAFPPKTIVDVDVVIGYGKDVGRHAPPIKCKYESKWVHFACSSSEVNIEDKPNLCEESDLTFAVGSDVAEECGHQLTFCEKEVHSFIPGIFSEIQMYRQAVRERKAFSVITFYPSVKEITPGKEVYKIPAKAVGALPDSKYRLIVVCAPGDKPHEVRKILLQHGVPRKQLKVRTRYYRMFVDADLLVLPFLPSKAEDFGLIALQAISEDLPVLVSSNSGLANALKDLPHGDLFVVDSDEPEEWKRRIMAVEKKDRSQRLSEAREMRERYNERYPWEGQCKTVLQKILQQGVLYFHFSYLQSRVIKHSLTHSFTLSVSLAYMLSHIILVEALRAAISQLSLFCSPRVL